MNRRQCFLMRLATVALLLALLGFQESCGCWLPSDVARPARGAHIKSGLEHRADPLRCSPSEAEWQANLFFKKLKLKYRYSACADHWWLRDVAEAVGSSGGGIAKQGRKAVIVDVGCNKGYFSVTALNYLAPGYGDQLKLFHKSHLERKVYDRPCGNCEECEQAPTDLKALAAAAAATSSGSPSKGGYGASEVDVFCYEPSEVHIVSLAAARDAVYGDPDVENGTAGGGNGTTAGGGSNPRVRFHIRQKAASNGTGTAQFPTGCTGNTCSLGAKLRGSAYLTLNLTTVDAEVAAAGLSRLDVLKIDTEGFDPAVLAGAYQTLKDKKVGALSFEYNSVWSRAGANLRQCLDYLEDLGYSCFWDGAQTAKLTGCWDHRYETKKWSNVVCAEAGGPLEAKLVAGSLVAENLTDTATTTTITTITTTTTDAN